jgi:hypothetical protein
MFYYYHHSFDKINWLKKKIKKYEFLFILSDLNDKMTSKRHLSTSLVEGDICQVCGDKARLHNYGALSCSSCKTFFRRHGFNIQVKFCINIFNNILFLFFIDCSNVFFRWKLSDDNTIEKIVYCLSFCKMSCCWYEFRINS